MCIKANADAMPDEEVVKKVLAGEIALFEILMRRYNQRLYRVARSILRDDSEAEDVVQDALVRGYTHLNQFAGDAKFSTWLTKIAVHESFARLRRRSRFVEIDSEQEVEGNSMSLFTSKTRNPEQEVLARELSAALEAAVDTLPEAYRTVFMLRDVEEMSIAETAECLDISEEAVKTRLHRARALLRKELYSRIGTVTTQSFQFAGSRCDHVVSAVFKRIAPQENLDTNLASPR
ncbi:MAG: RNA polymerase sigma factor [Candidatus Dadabacteria bacterium]|nr:RNA polymerase sigma factor [Candidatus Dadabacteria bacterium]